MNGVLVGVDGSPGAARALRWAAAEAASLRAPLTVCVVRAARDMPVTVLSHVRANEVLDAAELVTGRWPALTVHRMVAEGSPGTELRHLTASHQLAVVGARGMSGLTGTPIGAVATYLVAHAFCPVVVVPAEPVDPDAPVLVGVDGSDHNRPAVEFAYAAAERRGVPLTALTSVDGDPGLAGRAAEALREWHGKYPRVAVEHRLVDGPPATEIVAASSGASLVVVATRGQGGASGLLLGSVSRPVAQHAHCPVAVVHSASW